jgi:hypothetical protein
LLSLFTHFQIRLKKKTNLLLVLLNWNTAVPPLSPQSPAKWCVLLLSLWSRPNRPFMCFVCFYLNFRFVQHVFQIVTKDRVWVMYADSAKDAEGWVKQLTTTIAAIPQVTTHAPLYLSSSHYQLNHVYISAWQETSMRGLWHQRRRVENLCERSTHWLVQTLLCQSTRCC